MRLDKKFCYNCDETGHSLAACPYPLEDGGTKFASCFICNERWHLSKHCPKNTRGIYPKGGCCKICESVWHLAKDCPDKAKQGSRPSGGRAIKKVVWDTGKVTKFASGDELGDDFLMEKTSSGKNELNVAPTDSKKEASIRKKQGPKVLNFVG